MELTAAVLSVKVSLFLKREPSLPIDREYYWTDSKFVIGYINNEACRVHVYVTNRVQTIRYVTEPPSVALHRFASNPADQASRGFRASEINNSAWLIGPPLLWQPNIETQNVEAELHLGDPEVKSVRTLCPKQNFIGVFLTLYPDFHPGQS